MSEPVFTIKKETLPAHLNGVRISRSEDYDTLHASLSHLKQCAQAMVDAHPCAVQADCHCPTCTLTHALAAAAGGIK